MKNFLFISIIYLLSVYSVTNAQWVQTNTQPFGGYVLSFWKSDTSLIAGAGHGIYNSTDNGITWNELLPWTQLEFVSAIVAVTAESSSTILFAGGLGGVYLSTNGGTSWIAANSGLENKQVRSLAVISDEIEGTITLFAGTTTGVFRSTNNGTSWIASGLDSNDVYALTVTKDETGKAILIAGTEGNPSEGCVFHSTDFGISWTIVPLTTYNTTCFATSRDGVGNTNIYAGTYSGVYLSTDSGINWTHISTGLDWSVVCLEISPNETDGINLFAGTYNGGVFLSTNNGTNWTTINTGLMYENIAIQALIVSEGYLIAGADNGVWRRPLSELLPSTTSVNNSDGIPWHFSLEQNYPNPFNPSTKIKYSIPQSSNVVLKIYDVLGKEVATLVDEYKLSGSYDVEFSAPKLPSGTYFYQLKAGNFVETKKMILLR